MITIASLILVIVGAINWFSVGVFDFNIVNWIFPGDAYIGARIVYAIVGIAGLWLLIYLIFNKFNPRRINAVECKDKKDMKHENPQIDESIIEESDIVPTEEIKEKKNDN